MDAEDLKKRTKLFALRVLKLVAALPPAFRGKIDWRAAGSSWYFGWCKLLSRLSRASKAEFIAKLGIVEEEADESSSWMELIIESSLLRKCQVESLLNEANEIAKIMAQSRLTASGKSVTRRHQVKQ